MPRIRTIKPDFWTDAKIVRLPFEARLLFIGLFNFADDEGFLLYEPDQIQMQIFPGDNINIRLLLDFLIASGLIEICGNNNGCFIHITNFIIHQKISHPSQSKFIALCERKKIPISAKDRREIAKQYELKPGEQKTCTCHYCGHSGCMWWPLTSKNEPNYWVGFSLQIINNQKEQSNNENNANNYIFICEHCSITNEFLNENSILFENIHGGFREDSENTPRGRKEGRNGKEGNGKEGKEGSIHMQACADRFCAEYPIQKNIDTAKEVFIEYCIESEFTEKEIYGFCVTCLFAVRSQILEKEALAKHKCLVPEWKYPDNWIRSKSWQDAVETAEAIKRRAVKEGRYKKEDSEMFDNTIIEEAKSDVIPFS